MRRYVLALREVDESRSVERRHDHEVEGEGLRDWERKKRKEREEEVELRYGVNPRRVRSLEVVAGALVLILLQRMMRSLVDRGWKITLK